MSTKTKFSRTVVVRSVPQASAKRTLRKDPQRSLIGRYVYGHASLADRTAPQVSSQSPQERWRRRPDVRIDPRVRLQDPMPFPQRRRSGRRPPAFEKAARKLGIAEVILCDEWTSAQVKAFRLLVNRSVTWADCDEELLALELQEVQESDFDLSLTGFDPGEIDNL